LLVVANDFDELRESLLSQRCLDSCEENLLETFERHLVLVAVAGLHLHKLGLDLLPQHVQDEAGHALFVHHADHMGHVLHLAFLLVHRLHGWRFQSRIWLTFEEAFSQLMLFLVLVLYLFLLFRNWVFKAWEFFLNSFVFKGIKGVTLFRCHGLKTHRLSYLVPKVKLLALELIEESTAVAGRHLSLVSIAWGSSVFSA